MRAWVTMAAALAFAPPALGARVPFVGCGADGQAGPVAPPRAGRTPEVPAPAARQLAFYATAGVARMGVLGPRGWHCFGTYGSNGSTLFVAPHPLGRTMLAGNARLQGPVVQLRHAVGDTSGRVEVARIAARLFPAANAYVARVEAEGLLPGPFDRGPFPVDRISRRGPYQALFTTPPNRQGLGTQSMLAPDARPIDGIVLFDPHGDAGLTMLTARLPAPLRPLVAPMIAEVRARPTQ